MEEKETLKEKWERADKKILIAFAAGGIVGSILVKAHLKVEIKMARAEGYNKGTGDILKALLSDNK